MHLESLVSDTTLAGQPRPSTYHDLGVVYTIQEEYDQARSIIRSWIEVAPSTVNIDPTKDMLEFVELYYEVQKGINIERYCSPGYVSPHQCEYGRQHDPGIQTVAVVDFQNNSIMDRDNLMPLQAGLSDIMIRRLSKADRLIVVEREYIQWLLDELRLNQEAVIDDSTRIIIGKLMGAHSLLIGDFMNLSDTFLLGARLVEVSTSRVLLESEVIGELNDFLSLCDQLNEQIADKLDVPLTRHTTDSTVTNQLEALLAYARGSREYDRRSYDNAIRYFDEALRHDPSYAIAAKKRNDARRLLNARTPEHND